MAANDLVVGVDLQLVRCGVCDRIGLLTRSRKTFPDRHEARQVSLKLFRSQPDGTQDQGTVVFRSGVKERPHAGGKVERQHLRRDGLSGDVQLHTPFRRDHAGLQVSHKRIGPNGDIADG